MILAPEGEWDADGSPAFRRLALEAAEKGVQFFAVDFGKVTFIDSSALAVLVALFKRVNPTRNGDVKLFGMTEEVREIFRQTRLDRVFEIAAGYGDLKYPR